MTIKATIRTRTDLVSSTYHIDVLCGKVLIPFIVKTKGKKIINLNNQNQTGWFNLTIPQIEQVEERIKRTILKEIK